MKKQELIHLHGLLAEVKKYVEQESKEDISDLNNVVEDKLVYEYSNLNISHTDIHKGKSVHKKGVLNLAEIVSQGVEEVELSNTKEKEIRGDLSDIQRVFQDD